MAVNLTDVIAWVETKDNCKLFRFEPATYAKLSTAQNDVQKQILSSIQKANLCSLSTALMIYSTSWGRCQLMGFNLYAPQVGCVETIADVLANQTHEQDTYFTKLVNWQNLVLTPQQLSVPAERLFFARKYNGADSYADLIKASLTHFNLECH